MAEIEDSLLAKAHEAEGIHEQPVLIGFLRSRKRRIGTLIEATSGQSLKELKREVRKKGGKKIKVYKEINTIYAEMPVDKVTDLASVSCATKVYDAEGDIKLCLNESVPLVMGVEKWQLPYRMKRKKIEGKGIKVAVIDSGIDKKHPDLQGRIESRKNFSGGRRNRGIEHGTHVAGIIAGSGKVSGYRYTGVAPKVKLYDAKIFMNSKIPTTRNAVVEATLWAVKKKVHVVNMSFGDHQGCSDGTCILCKTTDYAISQGITVVAAAGNAGPAEGTISCPGNAERVVTVGATTKNSPTMVTGFSSRGSIKQSTKPDVVAPGDKIVAPQPKGQYTAMSGTSMATPHVTGLVALLYQSGKYVNGKKRMTPAEIKHTLKQGSIDLGEHSTAQGSGLVNFENELATMQQPRKRLWSPKRKKNTPQPIEQTPQSEVINDHPITCSAVMNMFCPHYDKHTCNEVYEMCIHYQSANQVKVLKEVKISHSRSLEAPTVDTLIEDYIVSPTYIGSRKLAGKVIGTIDGQPISGVTVSVGKRSITTDAKGKFTLRRAGKGLFAVVISGESIYPRSAAVNNTTMTRSVKLDVIEISGNFDLNFYRELARGALEGNMRPIHRWINPKAPTFYIDTNKSSIDGSITKSTIKKVQDVIQQVLPVFSGNLYQKTRIKIRKFSDDEYTFNAIPDNSVVISFDDKLGERGVLGIALTDPNLLSPTISFINKAWIRVVNHESFYSNNGISREELVTHELGHGFGYRHALKKPSVMSPRETLNNTFSEHDRLHMAIMYSRPVGNFDIDNDPAPARKALGKPIERQVFIDERATFSLPPKLKKQLASLPDLTHKLLQGANVVK